MYKLPNNRVFASLDLPKGTVEFPDGVRFSEGSILYPTGSTYSKNVYKPAGCGAQTPLWLIPNSTECEFSLVPNVASSARRPSNGNSIRMQSTKPKNSPHNLSVADFRNTAYYKASFDKLVQEEDDEQGVAHIVEHVTFLGSHGRTKM